MDQTQQNEKDYYTIDFGHIVKVLWQKIWIVVFAAALTAAVGFSLASFVIPPKYSSSILIYVNNRKNVSADAAINSSDIAASQSLVKTYETFLKNRTTLEKVIVNAGVDYTYEALNGMVEATAANQTQVMKVTVTTEDPYEASKIANSIAVVLPERITDIIEEVSVEVVEYAIPELKKVSPSITNYTAIGLVLGALLAAVVIAIIAVMDDTIHDEEYVIKTYNYPILAKVPNLLHTDSKGYIYKHTSSNNKN